MCQRVFSSIMVGIVVCIDGLCLESGNCIKLLDSCCTKPGQCTEHCTLDLGDLGILDRINQSILSLGGMVLQLLRCVLFAERGNLVEIHLEIVGHLSSKLILRSLHARGLQEREVSTIEHGLCLSQSLDL